MAENIGGVFLPALTSVATMINTQLAGPQAQALLAGLTTALGLLFKGDLKGFIDNFAVALGNVFGFDRAVQIAGFLNGIKDTASTAFTFISTNVLPALGTAFGNVLTKVGEFKTWITTNGPGIMGALGTAWGEFRTNILEPLSDKFFLLWLKLNDIKLWMQVYGPGVLDELKKPLQEFIDKHGPAFEKALASVGTKLGELKAIVQENAPIVKAQLIQMLQDAQLYYEQNMPLIEKAWAGLMRNINMLTKKGGEEQTVIGEEYAGLYKVQTQSTMDTLGQIVHLGLRFISGEWIDKLKEIKTTVDTKWEEIRVAIDTKLVEMGQNIQARFSSIKLTVSTTWEDIKKSIGQAIESIKQMFRDLANFHIPTPHFSLSSEIKELLGMQIPVPKIDISWYGKGIDAIFSKPTIIGVGESGPERVSIQPLGQQRMSAPAMTNNYYGGNVYNLSASYSQYQNEGSLRDTVRLLQAGL